MAYARSHTPEQTIESLIELLRQETHIYRELAQVLEEERGAMLGMDIDRLADIVPRKETLALRIKALDESRKMISGRLAQQYTLPVTELTVSCICGLIGADPGARLSAVRDELKTMVMRCQELNTHNERAARTGLELVHNAMEFFIHEADPAGKVYQAPNRAARGYRPAAGATGLLSRQA